MSETILGNSLDVITPVVHRLEDRGSLSMVQIVGGIGSAAFRHPGTVIYPDERRVITSREFLNDNPDLGFFRENGTLRDFDALVLSADDADVNAVEKTAEEEIDDKLRISIFRFVNGEHFQNQIAHPLGKSALLANTSDRYVQPNGSLIRGLFPFAVPIPDEALESWTLEIGDEEYPIVNPAAAPINYLTRSISGLRPKDAKKVPEMMRHIAEVWPGAVEWMVDGPGKSQMEFAAILQTLRRGGPFSYKRTLDVGGVISITAGHPRTLYEEEAFVMRDADTKLQRAVLLTAITKARALGGAESNETVVRIWQEKFEPMVDDIIKNKK